MLSIPVLTWFANRHGKRAAMIFVYALVVVAGVNKWLLLVPGHRYVILLDAVCSAPIWVGLSMLLPSMVADACGLKIPGMRAGPAFWDRFLSPARRLREQYYASAWAHAVESARRIGELAQAAGITLALENVENEFLCSPRDWDDLLTEIAHPSVGMYFDVGNVVRNRQGPPARWLDALGPKWVRRIHFKGAFVGGPLVSLLDGEVPWPEVVASMQKLAYRDWVGIEMTPPAHCQQAWLKIACLSAREILAF